MQLLSTVDIVALCWFLGAWIAYSATLSLTSRSKGPGVADT